MRSIRVILIGGALAAAAMAISRSSSGIIEAASFMLAPLIAAVTIGVAIALAVERRDAREARPGRLSRRLARGRLQCTSCRRPMAQMEVIWVCRACDSIAVEASA